MYELKKNLELYLRGNLLGPGPRIMKKSIYRAAVSRRLRNIGVWYRNIALIQKVKRYLRKKIVMAKCVSLSEGLSEWTAYAFSKIIQQLKEVYFSLFPTWYTVFPSTYNICYLLSSTCFRPHRPIIRKSKLYMQPVVFSPWKRDRLSSLY